MPATIVSETTLTLFSHDSCTFTVSAGEPTDIEDKFVPDAVSRGCSFYAADAKLPKGPPQLSIEDAVMKLIGEGDGKKFNSLNGLPKVGAVSDLVGRKVTTNEIQAVWDEIGLSESSLPKEEDAE